MSGVVLQVDLVTPEKLLLSREVLSVTVPGVDGDFGVLANHAPFLSGLRAGEVTVGEGPEAELFVVASGVAEVLPERVTLLVDKAVRAQDIQVEAARAEMQEAGGRLAQLAEEDPEYGMQLKRRDYAEAQIELAQRLARK